MSDFFLLLCSRRAAIPDMVAAKLLYFSRIASFFAQKVSLGSPLKGPLQGSLPSAGQALIAHTAPFYKT
jgi:hypothetical protein